MTATPDREYPARPVVGVGAVVFITPHHRGMLDLPGEIPDSGVLLVRRRFQPLAGQWSLPGGMLEVGETLAAGVAREVLEETGLVVDPGPVVEVLDRITLDSEGRVQYHFVLVDYLCRPAGGRLRACSDAAEVAIGNAGALEPFGLTLEAGAVIRRALALEAVASNQVRRGV